jgi:hypothetical protein
MSTAFQTYLRGTFLELENGFHFASPPPADVISDRYLNSSDPGDVLACVLARCQQGSFDAVSRLLDVLRREDSAVVTNACCQLIGFTGGRRLLEQIVQQYAGELDDPGVQHDVPAAIVNAGALWAVPHLLAMHEVAVDVHARISLEQRLSLLLEPDSGPVWQGPEERSVVEDDSLPEAFREERIELDEQGYRALVLGRLKELQASGSLNDRNVFYAEGAPLEVEQLARTMMRRIGSNDFLYRIEWERMVLEATTGVSCRAFFNSEGRLQPLAAVAVIEEFLDSRDAARFAPGVRYFFGHRVPD